MGRYGVFMLCLCNRVTPTLTFLLAGFQFEAVTHSESVWGERDAGGGVWDRVSGWGCRSVHCLSLRARALAVVTGCVWRDFVCVHICLCHLGCEVSSCAIACVCAGDAVGLWGVCLCVCYPNLRVQAAVFHELWVGFVCLGPRCTLSYTGIGASARLVGHVVLSACTVFSPAVTGERSGYETTRERERETAGERGEKVVSANTF